MVSTPAWHAGDLGSISRPGMLYFRYKPEQGFVPMASELRVVLIISGLFTVFYVLVAGPMSDIATAAARTFF